MRKIVIVGISATVAALLVATLGYRLISKQKSVGEAVVTQDTIAVVTRAVAVDSIVEIATFTGTLKAVQEVLVVTQSGGVLEKLNTGSGKLCKADEVLGEIDRDLQSAALDQATAAVMVAQTNVEKIRRDADRISRLLKDSIATKDQSESIDLSLKSAEAQLLGAIAEKKRTAKQLDDTYIRAPIDGRIALCHAVKGMTLAPGTPFAMVVDDRRFKLTISVGERLISRIHTGQTARVEVDALTGETIIGTVAAMDGVPDDKSGSYGVEITLDAPSHPGLRSGMFARSAITFGTTYRQLIIPKTAVSMGNGNEGTLFVDNGGVASLRTIQCGIADTGRIAVLQGVVAGERVVVEGRERLRNGSPIRAKGVTP